MLLAVIEEIREGVVKTCARRGWRREDRRRGRRGGRGGGVVAAFFGRQSKDDFDKGLIAKSHGAPSLGHLQVEDVEIGVVDDDVDELAFARQVAQARHRHAQRTANADAAVE